MSFVLIMEQKDVESQDFVCFLMCQTFSGQVISLFIFLYCNLGLIFVFCLVEGPTLSSHRKAEKESVFRINFFNP